MAQSVKASAPGYVVRSDHQMWSLLCSIPAFARYSSSVPALIWGKIAFVCVKSVVIEFIYLLELRQKLTPKFTFFSPTLGPAMPPAKPHNLLMTYLSRTRL